LDHDAGVTQFSHSTRHKCLIFRKSTGGEFCQIPGFLQALLTDLTLALSKAANGCPFQPG